jgi:AcrR family transcriptional regulator
LAGNDDNQLREDRILNAASKLVVHYGYDKTTVSDIAREAGVSKGAIYLHWASKYDLFEALIFREGERLVDDMLVRMDTDPDAGSIFSLYQYAIVVTIANPVMHAVVTNDLRVTGDFMRRWVQKNPVTEGQWFRTDLVRQLQAANVIRSDLDAEVVAYVMALIRYGFLTVHQVVPSDESPPLDAAGKTLALMLERALSPEGGPNREAGKRVLGDMLLALRDLVRRYREKR